MKATRVHFEFGYISALRGCSRGRKKMKRVVNRSGEQSKCARLTHTAEVKEQKRYSCSPGSVSLYLPSSLA